jgi:hypothetical protein
VSGPFQELKAELHLAENGWVLRKGSNPDVLVAERGDRKVYGKSASEIIENIRVVDALTKRGVL